MIKSAVKKEENKEVGILPTITRNLSSLRDPTPNFLSPWTKPRDLTLSKAEKFDGDEICDMMNQRSPLKIHDFDLDKLPESATPLTFKSFDFDLPFDIEERHLIQL